jgi:hypothetical protein
MLKLSEWRDIEGQRLVQAVEHPTRAVSALSCLIGTFDQMIDNERITDKSQFDIVQGLLEGRALLKNMRHDIIRTYGVIDEVKEK